jgi:hypothetical protein
MRKKIILVKGTSLNEIMIIMIGMVGICPFDISITKRFINVPVIFVHDTC